MWGGTGRILCAFLHQAAYLYSTSLGLPPRDAGVTGGLLASRVSRLVTRATAGEQDPDPDDALSDDDLEGLPPLSTEDVWRRERVDCATCGVDTPRQLHGSSRAAMARSAAHAGGDLRKLLILSRPHDAGAATLTLHTDRTPAGWLPPGRRWLPPRESSPIRPPRVTGTPFAARGVDVRSQFSACVTPFPRVPRSPSPVH